MYIVLLVIFLIVWKIFLKSLMISVDRSFLVVFIFERVGLKVRGVVNKILSIKSWLWFIFVMSLAAFNNCVELRMLKAVLDGMIFLFFVE